MSDLKKIALELLEKYHSAEDMVIGETSINLKADGAELDAQIADYKARIEAHANLIDVLLDGACGTLADIAFSADLMLEGCRSNARYRYEIIRATTGDLPTRIESAEPKGDCAAALTDLVQKLAETCPKVSGFEIIAYVKDWFLPKALKAIAEAAEPASCGCQGEHSEYCPVSGFII